MGIVGVAAFSATPTTTLPTIQPDPSDLERPAMPAASDTTPFRCVTCEAEIRTRPVFHVGLAFCCAGCVADGPCLCSYDPEPGPVETAASAMRLDAVADERRPVTAPRVRAVA